MSNSNSKQWQMISVLYNYKHNYYNNNNENNNENSNHVSLMCDNNENMIEINGLSMLIITICYYLCHYYV